MNGVLRTINILVALAASTRTASTPANGTEVARIANGIVVRNITGWEFIAAIRSYYDPVCSGVVLSKNFTMTTCKCAYKIEGIIAIDEDIRIVAGASIVEAGRGQWQHIKNTTKHPYCSNETIYQEMSGFLFDYAVVRVDPGFIFNVDVKPIVLPSWDQRTFEHHILDAVRDSKQCEVAGWGKTQVAFPGFYFLSSPVLLKKTLELLSWTQCSDIVCHGGKNFPYCSSGPLLTGKVCANPVGAGNSCEEDEGGPLVCDGLVFGLISHIESCGEHNEPNYYARLDIALPFLRKYAKASGEAHTIQKNFKTLLMTVVISLLSQ